MNAQDLKNSILQLAIQGKLVEQCSEEGTAEELYEQIQEEKVRLIAEGKIKKEKALSDITEEEIPFDIPESWKWVRLSDVLQIINGDRGKNYPSKSTLTDNGIPFISAINIDNQTISEQKLLYMSDEQYNKLGSGKLVLGDLVICIRGSLGKNGRYPFEKGAIASSLVILRNFLESDVFYEFISKYINSGLFTKEVNRYNNGTAQPNLGARDLAKFIIPLPPLEEQKRIVVKIEELMPYVDKYGESYTKLEELNRKFPEDMQKSILQYAIQGKLVEQRPEEGTAHELYEEIQVKKYRLIAEGKIKKEKALPEIADEEIPFDIPASWKWVRLRDIGLTQTGNTPSKSKIEYYGNQVPFVGPGNINDGVISCDNNGLSELGVKKGRVVSKGSILQVCIGGSIGKCAINKVKLAYNQQINAITTLGCDSKYIYSILQSQFFNTILKKKSTGTATPIINKSSWECLLIPLPPLEEQKRIVAKIEKILPNCDDLKKNR